MDFIEFCEKELEHPLNDWQKTYLTNMYDMIKKAKEENREIIITPSRGSSKNRIHIAALLLAHEYETYLHLKGEKDG